MVWKFEEFKVIPLEKGLYNFLLHNLNDQSTGLTKGGVFSKQGVFGFNKWTLRFNVYSHQYMTTHVWIYIFNLPIEFKKP